MCPSVSDFDRFSLTLARWLTSVYDEDDPAESSTTPGDVTASQLITGTSSPPAIPVFQRLDAAQGQSAEERESSTFYREEVMAAEYAAIFAVASDNLRLGHSVVVDAPFAAYLDKPDFFNNAARAAHWALARRSVLHVYASEAQTQRRLRDRGLPRDQAKLRDWTPFWPTCGDLTVSWTGVRVIKVDNDSTADIDGVLALLNT